MKNKQYQIKQTEVRIANKKRKKVVKEQKKKTQKKM